MYCFIVFQEKQRFLTDVLHEVMLLDGLVSSHPVSQEVQQATDIDRVFDWIAYKKVGIEIIYNCVGFFCLSSSLHPVHASFTDGHSYFKGVYTGIGMADPPPQEP